MRRSARIALGISLCLWIGGIVALSIVAAPAIFGSLSSRTQAGQVFGGVLRAFSWIQIGCSLVASGSLAFLIVRTEKRGWPHALLALLVGSMALLALAHDLYVLPTTHQVRSRISSFDSPAAPDEREAREAFDRLHQVSVWIYALNILLGISAVGVSSVVEWS